MLCALLALLLMPLAVAEEPEVMDIPVDAPVGEVGAFDLPFCEDDASLLEAQDAIDGTDEPPEVPSGGNGNDVASGTRDGSVPGMGDVGAGNGDDKPEGTVGDWSDGDGNGTAPGNQAGDATGTNDVEAGNGDDKPDGMVEGPQGEDAGTASDDPDDGGTNADDGTAGDDLPGDSSPIAGEQAPQDPGIRFAATTDTIGVGEKIDLGAQYVPAAEDGESLPLRYEAIQSRKYVSVSASGIVKGLKKGSAEIRVSAEDGTEATYSIRVAKAPTSIKLNAKKVTLGYDAEAEVGMPFQIKAKLSSGSASSITYSGYSQKVLSVDPEGRVMPVGTGSTTVTAKTFNGKKAKLKVTVQKAPDGVSLNASALTLGAGDGYALTAAIPAKTTSDLTFDSSDPDCVGVDPKTGHVTALSEGTADVTVRTFNDKKAVCAVTVVGSPDGVGLTDPFDAPLDGSMRQMGVKETLQLKAHPTLNGAPLDGTLKYECAPSKIASVSKAGLVRAKKKGRATITVTASSGAKATLELHVVKAPGKITLAASMRTLGYDASLPEEERGEHFSLSPKLPGGTASAISYSYNSDVVSVAPDGTVTALSMGTTKITATTFNKKKASCTVTVVPAPAEISLDRQSAVIAVGQRFALKSALPVGTASALKWESDAPECVAVDGSGTLTALAEGEAKITAETYNGHLATCDITVLPSPSSLEVSPAAVAICVGESDIALDAVFDVGRLDGGVTFKSGSTKIAKVGPMGVITGVKTGKTSIRVTSYDGKLVKSIPVNVYAAPKWVSLGDRVQTVDLGGTLKLNPTFPKGQASGVTYESADKSIATVDANGLVSGEALGNTEVTVRAYKVEDHCRIDVVPPAAEVRMAEEVSITETLYSDFDIAVLDGEGEPYRGPVEVRFEPEGAAVWSDGRLLGKKPGRAVMRVTASGVTASCEIDIAAYRSHHPVLSVAHRGASGYKPENTLEAFRYAATLGADAIELDVHTTLDGIQVVHHDRDFTVKKVRYVIAETEYSVLKKAKPSLCTLEEALDVIRETSIGLHLELKENADGGKCVQFVEDHGMKDRTVYFSFYENCLKDVYDADHGAFLGKSLMEPPPLEEVRRMKEEFHLSFLVASRKTTMKSDIDAWHNMGLNVCIWTVNDKKLVKKFCDMNVDYILSDYPEYCVRVR